MLMVQEEGYFWAIQHRVIHCGLVYYVEETQSDKKKSVFQWISQQLLLQRYTSSHCLLRLLWFLKPNESSSHKV